MDSALVLLLRLLLWLLLLLLDLLLVLFTPLLAVEPSSGVGGITSGEGSSLDPLLGVGMFLDAYPSSTFDVLARVRTSWGELLARGIVVGGILACPLEPGLRRKTVKDERVPLPLPPVPRVLVEAEPEAEGFEPRVKAVREGSNDPTPECWREPSVLFGMEEEEEEEEAGRVVVVAFVAALLDSPNPVAVDSGSGESIKKRLLGGDRFSASCNASGRKGRGPEGLCWLLPLLPRPRLPLSSVAPPPNLSCCSPLSSSESGGVIGMAISRVLKFVAAIFSLGSCSLRGPFVVCDEVVFQTVDAPSFAWLFLEPDSWN